MLCHIILQANLGFLKVLVAKSQAEGLQMHLKSMVEGLLKWQDNSRNHFKAKVVLLVSWSFFLDTFSLICSGWQLFQHWSYYSYCKQWDSIFFRLNFFWECLSRSVGSRLLKPSCLKNTWNFFPTYARSVECNSNEYFA